MFFSVYAQSVFICTHQNEGSFIREQYRYDLYTTLKVDGENKVEYLETPFGKVKILIDDIEVSYNAVKKQPNERFCPDIVGRYHTDVKFTPDGKEHEIKCIIENISYLDRGPESGEMLECQAFYNEDGWKLSIGVECETGFLPDGRR